MRAHVSRWFTIAIAGTMCVGAPLAAQQRFPAGVQVPSRSDISAASTATAGDVAWNLQAATRAPWYAPLASLVVPGSGQLLLGQQRGVGYLVLDGYLLLQARAAQQDGARARTAYRQLAAQVARAQFGGVRPDGGWPYYEAMEHYLESGQFRVSTEAGTMPETDESTFNGAQWRLARETFWVDPESPPPIESAEYQRALAFYEGRAIRDEFRWSWRDAQLQQDVYRQTISSSNRNYQRAVNLVSAVAANHLMAMVDAFLTVRLRRLTGTSPGETHLRSGLTYVDSPEGAQLVPGVTVALPLPRRGGP